MPRAKKDDTPCEEHFPTGWPDGVTAVGCEHGSWTRSADSADNPAGE